jgi:iron complex outermembrane receptor protein
MMNIQASNPGPLPRGETSRFCYTHRLAGAAILAGLLGLSSAPLLQAQPGEKRVLEEILVTAQKRQESLQDVPISMTVLGSDELSELSIFDFTETAQLTPGVNLFPGVQTAAIRLRGVGPAFFALTSPQSVAVFVDDFAQSSVGAVFATLVDIERVELLRGPQGTLYGLNAPGGAYNITTRAPNLTEVEGYVETSYSQYDSSGLESVDMRGAINVPLVQDTLALRVAGVYADSDGFIDVKNPVSGADSTGGKEHKALRSRMLWQMSPDMDLTWNINYHDLADNPATFNVDGIVPGTGGANPIPAISNEFDDNRYYADYLSEAQTDLKDTSVHWRWDHQAVNVEFLAFYQEFDSYLLENREPFPGRNNKFEIQLDWEATSVELRFSNTGDKFDYIAGIYYANRDIDGFFDVTLTGVNLLGPALGSGDIKAVYANLKFHLAEQWDLSLGGRYDKNEVETKSDFEFLGLRSVVDDTASYDAPSWSIKLQHYFNENMTGYLAIDHAYKQGGFNNLVPGLEALATLVPDIAAAGEQMSSFDEETSTSYEIGLKGSALEGRMNYNLAAFYQEFDDHQLIQPIYVTALKTPLGDLSALFSNQLVNAEEVLTKGVELDVAYLLAQYWDISLRVAYFDATIEDWSFRFCPEGEEQSSDQLVCPTDGGQNLNTLPQWSTNMQLGHARPLSESWGFYGVLNWSWQSEPNVDGSHDPHFDSKSLLGLTLGLRSVAGLDIRLWGKNLTNEDLNADVGRRADGDPSFLQPFGGNYFPGRELGVTLSYGF